jgi:hypothetical protein
MNGIAKELEELYAHAIKLKLEMGKGSVTDEKILTKGGNIKKTYIAHFRSKYEDPKDAAAALLREAEKALERGKYSNFNI